MPSFLPSSIHICTGVGTELTPDPGLIANTLCGQLPNLVGQGIAEAVNRGAWEKADSGIAIPHGRTP